MERLGFDWKSKAPSHETRGAVVAWDIWDSGVLIVLLLVQPPVSWTMAVLSVGVEDCNIPDL